MSAETYGGGERYVSPSGAEDPFYQRVQSPAGTSLPQRDAVAYDPSFFSVSDDPVNSATLVTVAGTSNAISLLQAELVLGSDQQDVTFNFNGDADGDLEVRGSFRNASASSFADIKFNGSSTNVSQRWRMLDLNSAVWSTDVDFGFFVAAGDAANSDCDFVMRVRTKTGARRHATIEYVGQTAGAAGVPRYVNFNDIIWDDTATNMTSLTLHGRAAAYFKAGSRFTVLKIRR